MIVARVPWLSPAYLLFIPSQLKRGDNIAYFIYLAETGGKMKNNNLKDCSKIKELYTFYVYKDVSPEEEKAISEHLKECPECASEVDSLRKTVDLLNMEAELKVPQNILEDFESKVYKRIAAESIKSPVSNFFSNIMAWFSSRRLVLVPSAAAAFIVGIFIGVYAVNPLFNNQPEEIYPVSYPPAHKRIEQYNQRELQRQWEEAVLTRYVEGDDWDAANQFMRIREENPGTTMASMAEMELSKTKEFSY